jgi:hypothetical protein
MGDGSAWTSHRVVRIVSANGDSCVRKSMNAGRLALRLVRTDLNTGNSKLISVAEEQGDYSSTCLDLVRVCTAS